MSMGLDYDVLLAYLSERRTGTWEAFKDAVDWLNGVETRNREVAWIAARRLEDLGHIEVNWEGGKSWAICPTVITLVSRSGGRALVTGSRPADFYDVGSSSGILEDAAEELGLFVECVPQLRAPTTLLVQLDNFDQADELAGHLGARCTFNVSEDIASQLPRLVDYLDVGTRRELPIGFEAEKFDPKSLAFEIVDETESTGLYRTRTYGDVIHALNDVKSSNATDETVHWNRLPREYAVYEIFRWEGQRVLCFDYKKMSLWVPKDAGLPTLHSRCATLCSGRLPEGDSEFTHPTDTSWRCIRYENVPDRIASLIAESLSQEVIKVNA